MIRHDRFRIGYVLRCVTVLLLLLAVASCVSVTDYSELSWPDAYDTVEAEMRERYPFYDWKGAADDPARDGIRAEIRDAWAEGDRETYYLRLREYAYSFHDSHISLETRGADPVLERTAGSYGLGLLALDDGRVIAHYISPDGSARETGLDWGDEILRWNGEEIHTAAEGVATHYADVPPATGEAVALARYSLLTRAPVGNSVAVEYIDGDTGMPVRAVLTAGNDENRDLEAARVARDYPGGAFLSPVQSHMVEPGMGYIQIKRFMPSLFAVSPYADFRKSLLWLMMSGADQLIIDLRGNQGGLDTLVPKIAGHLIDTETFYQYVSYYDEESGEFQINEKETLTVRPRRIRFKGALVILVDSGTLSTAEGLPLLMQRTGRGVVMGQYGTGGTFGCGLSKVFRLPEDVLFAYSPGRSLDSHRTIQVDSDADLDGGIRPDIRVPVDYDTAYRRWVEGEDVLLEAAIEYLRDGQ